MRSSAIRARAADRLGGGGTLEGKKKTTAMEIQSIRWKFMVKVVIQSATEHQWHVGLHLAPSSARARATTTHQQGMVICVLTSCLLCNKYKQLLRFKRPHSFWRLKSAQWPQSLPTGSWITIHAPTKDLIWFIYIRTSAYQLTFQSWLIVLSYPDDFRFLFDMNMVLSLVL